MKITDADDISRLDAATSKRLAGLSSAAVDTSELEERLGGAMHAMDQGERRIRPAALWGSVAGAAAAVLVIGVIGWMMIHTVTPAVASPSELAMLHRDVLGGSGQPVLVGSIEEANRHTARQWSQAPEIPRLNNAQVRSCCLHPLAGARVVCVLMEHPDQPITLVVARGKDLTSPNGQVIERDGRHFIAHEMNGLQMLMGSRDDRWLCVMGRVSIETLLAVAENIDF